MRKRQKRHGEFLSELTPVCLTAAQQVWADLTDPGDVMGVAWSPKYRAWRAYLHVDRRQVHHSLHQTKEAAIAARRQAEFEFCRSTATREQVQQWYPAAALRRHHRAPKVAARKTALLRAGRVMREVSRLVNRASAVWPEDETGRGRSPMGRDMERLVGLRVGQVLALAEYLRMTGDLRVEDIETGMLQEVNRILRYDIYVTKTTKKW
jgi:hypothetical protein